MKNIIQFLSKKWITYLSGAFNVFIIYAMTTTSNNNIDPFGILIGTIVGTGIAMAVIYTLVPIFLKQNGIQTSKRANINIALILYPVIMIGVDILFG